MVKNDYIMQLINEMVRTIAKMIFNKDIKTAEDFDLEDKEVGEVYRQLMAMANDGRIGEAEDSLLDMMDTDKPEHLKLALMFYDGLNEFDTEMLDDNDFSREEISDGIKHVLSVFGYGGLTALFAR